VQSTCESDADCGGLLCAGYLADPGCNFPAFGCQTYEDECMNDTHCAAGEMCTFLDDLGHRACTAPNCQIGRPFLVCGDERLAALARRGDWLADVQPSLSGLSPAARAELAEAWTRIALMEHASIAAFARFSLELLAFGAPPRLLESTTRAMSDETRHARAAFAVASRYAGAPRGPGPLSIEGSLTSPDLDASVLTAFLEGCIGETVAALEAREAAAFARDPAVRTLLEMVADDESNHALLAYEFLKWALPKASPSLVSALRERVRSELQRAESALKSSSARPESEHVEVLDAHGILSERRRWKIRKLALLDVVGPCLDALLASGTPRVPAPPQRLLG
jgi:hypothetical protein